MRPYDDSCLSFHAHWLFSSWIIFIARIASAMSVITAKKLEITVYNDADGSAPHSSGLSGVRDWCPMDNTSLHVSMPVTTFAAKGVYMRDHWATIKQTPIVCGHMDWSLTVPLQRIECYCIPKAVEPELGTGIFWHLSIGTVVMFALTIWG